MDHPNRLLRIGSRLSLRVLLSAAGPLLLLMAVGGCATETAVRGRTADRGDTRAAAFNAFSLPLGQEDHALLGALAARNPNAIRPVVINDIDAASGQTAEDPSTPVSARAADSDKRLVIYTGRFALLVSNVADSIRSFITAIEERGGYLQRRDGGAVTCRVPAQHFDAVVEGLSERGALLEEKVEAHDVTREHQDLELRIQTAKSSRQRLLTLLEKADDVKAVLEIERELRRLTEEIESLEGELRFMKDQIAYSTITVDFRSAAPPPRTMPRRTYNRFEWLNRVGVENVLDWF